MHARFSQHMTGESGRGMQGTFYPSSGPRGDGSISAALPKLIAIQVAMAVIRNVVGGMKHHGGSSGWSRRREAIAEYHRELHARDAAAQAAAPVKA